MIRNIITFLLCMASINVAVADNLPIEINSDELEVLQPRKQAVFTGNVIARQGDITLSADKMLVYYQDTRDKPGNYVSKVETNGNVTLKTPKESAQSNAGFFDADNNTINLVGNVRLASGKTVVNGEKLVYNLTTGESRLINGGGAGHGEKGRVRGIFTPDG